MYVCACVQNEKNNIVGMHVGNPKAKSSSASGSDKHHKEKEEAAQQQYPDLIDMTEMDYSPARRKPPIHNWSISILIKN